MENIFLKLSKEEVKHSERVKELSEKSKAKVEAASLAAGIPLPTPKPE